MNTTLKQDVFKGISILSVKVKTYLALKNQGLLISRLNLIKENLKAISKYIK